MDGETRRAGECPVKLPLGKAILEGDLCVAGDSPGIVVFAHGSGSSRTSPRNRYVAQVLRNAGLGTLLFDLLTPAEEREDTLTARLRFDIGFLTERLIGATDWLGQNDTTRGFRLGYFGASTGAAAALMAAADRWEVGAIVSRGGRPDLAARLDEVRAPTLLIVGGDDLPVIEMNRQALAELRVEKKLVIVPGASHLFEEPGALEQVAQYARDWFLKYLGGK